LVVFDFGIIGSIPPKVVCIPDIPVVLYEEWGICNRGSAEVRKRLHFMALFWFLRGLLTAKEAKTAKV
jgi:hypothetical protein